MRVRTGVITGVLAIIVVAGSTAAQAQKGGSQNPGDPTTNPIVVPTTDASGTPKSPRSSPDWGKFSDPVGANNPDTLERPSITGNGDRQKQMKAEAAKLLALVNELKREVDQTDSDKAALDTAKKTDEIEKLAHALKETMKN